MKLYKYIFLILLACLPLVTQAQQVEMADDFRKDGKIYVVVAVVSIILAGLFVYLFLLDRKVGKIEKQLKK
ncbi:MAG TPA: CcmD family protein [Cytophagaceae bacterium]|jgi:CcmD family protein|nr:CcmD family protein [Cytophagaceae bacterium]